MINWPFTVRKRTVEFVTNWPQAYARPPKNNYIFLFLNPSYGNKTKSNIKYKTFFNSANTRSLSDNHVNSLSNDMTYSSSALYSQSSRSVPRIYAHYLNILIESEEDEGVYQCINPDWPNFIIQNVTVQIGSKLQLNCKKISKR